jgi:hypothetical protein
VFPCAELRGAQVTGTATTRDAELYAETGFSGTLGKPFSMDALRRVIAEFVGVGDARATVVVVGDRVLPAAAVVVEPVAEFDE